MAVKKEPIGESGELVLYLGQKRLKTLDENPFDGQGYTTEEKIHLFQLLQKYVEREMKSKVGKPTFKASMQNGVRFLIFVIQITKEKQMLTTNLKTINECEELLRSYLGIKELYQFLTNLKGEHNAESVFKKTNSEKTFQVLYKFKFSSEILTGVNNIEALQKVYSDFIFWIKISHKIITENGNTFKFMVSENHETRNYTLSQEKVFSIFLVSITLNQNKIVFTIDDIDKFVKIVKTDYDTWESKVYKSIIENFPDWADYILTNEKMIHIMKSVKVKDMLSICKFFMLDPESMKVFGRMVSMQEKVLDTITKNYRNYHRHDEVGYKKGVYLHIRNDSVYIKNALSEFPYLIKFLSERNIITILGTSFQQGRATELGKVKKIFDIDFLGDLEEEKFNQKFTLTEIMNVFWQQDRPFGFDRSLFAREKPVKEPVTTKKQELFNEDKKPQKIFLFYKLMDILGFKFFCEWLVYIYEVNQSVLPEHLLPTWFLVALHYMKNIKSEKIAKINVPEIYYSYKIPEQTVRILLNNFMQKNFETNLYRRMSSKK